MSDKKIVDEQAVKQAESALKSGFAEVKTASDAKRVLNQVEDAGADIQEEDLEGVKPADAADQASSLRETAESSSPSSRPAAVLAEAAAQVAGAPPDDRLELDQAIHEASIAEDSPRACRGRNLLRRELLRRLQPLDALDATLFIQVNHLPHPAGADRSMARLSWLMTGGHAWLLVPLIHMLADRRKAFLVVRDVLPAIYLTTLLVEGPIKTYFRRRRPFISIVRAIVVGRKPGSYSFPSGHSAAAFAGATLLTPHYPRAAKLFFLLALLVAFSRVYLGAHYPADVVSGSVTGSLLSRTFQSVLRKLLFR